MTFILGAKCIDGVVLVGDTKVTINDRMDFAYAKKLTQTLNLAVLGAAGSGGLFSSFQNRFRINFKKLTKEGERFDSHELMQTLVEDTIREMHRIYGKDRYIITEDLSVLVAMRAHENAELVSFDGWGIPEPVDKIRVIGSGEHHGALFIKTMWNPNMTMEQTAKLALFIIELIQDKINASVGYKGDYLPQVFYLPNLKIDESLRKAKLNMTEDQIHKKADELHKEQPIRELPEETIRDYLKTVGSIKSRLIELLKESQLSL